MAYIDNATVRKESGFSNNANISDSFIDAKIAYADSVINSKIRDVYALPLATPIPSVIKFLSLDIACALLNMAEYGEETQNVDKGSKKRLDVAMAVLDDIQSMKMKLTNDTTGAELARSTHNQPSFRPNDTTSDPDYDNTTQPKVGMNSTF